jgi:hypothetical protein
MEHAGVGIESLCTTSGLSPFNSPSALGAEVVSAAAAKHETQGLGVAAGSR